MKKIVFDLESNGLLYESDRIWCICLSDLEEEGIHSFYGGTLFEGIDVLKEADLLIGHNICYYDVTIIEKILGVTLPLNKCRDTYIMSKMLYPTRPSHSLESYGSSLNIEKIQHEDWSQFSDEMLERCRVDVQLNKEVYKSMLPDLKKHKWLPSILIENEMHYWQAQQELEGIDVDEALACDLLNKIDREVEDIDRKLEMILPKRVKPYGATIVKPFKKDGSYTKRVVDWWRDAEEEEESDSE